MKAAERNWRARMKEDAPLRARPPPAIIDGLCVRMKNYGRRMVILDEKGGWLEAIEEIDVRENNQV